MKGLWFKPILDHTKHRNHTSVSKLEVNSERKVRSLITGRSDNLPGDTMLSAHCCNYLDFQFQTVDKTLGILDGHYSLDGSLLQLVDVDVSGGDFPDRVDVAAAAADDARDEVGGDHHSLHAAKIKVGRWVA